MPVSALPSGCPVLDVDSFARERRRSGTTLGDPAFFSVQTASTNDDALAAARSGATHGALFATSHQTAGRGRRGRRWQSPPGSGLAFSLLLRPRGAAELGAQVTLAVGLGVRAGLQPWARPPLSVKWPNDVWAADHKLAGVLCEGQAREERLAALVVGVGANLRAVTLDGVSRAIGLEQLSSRDMPSREALLARLLLEIERRVGPCLDGAQDELRREFSEHDALRGRDVVVESEHSLRGKARGIDATGRLLVETERGLVHVRSGSVRLA